MTRLDFILDCYVILIHDTFVGLCLNHQTALQTRDDLGIDQDLLYNYESNLTTGEEIEIDEEKKLSIVVDGQRSETDL